MPVITTLTKRNGLLWLCETMTIIAEELGYQDEAQAIRDRTPWQARKTIDRAPAGLPKIVNDLKNKLGTRKYSDDEVTAAKAIMDDEIGKDTDRAEWLSCVAPWHSHFLNEMDRAGLWPSVVPVARTLLGYGLIVATVEGRKTNPNCLVRDYILIESERALCAGAIVDNSMLVVHAPEPVGPYLPWDATLGYDPEDYPTRDFAHEPGSAADLLVAIQLFPGEDEQAAVDLSRTVRCPVLDSGKALNTTSIMAPEKEG